MKNNKNGILLDLYKNSSFTIFFYPFITIRKSNEINISLITTGKLIVFKYYIISHKLFVLFIKIRKLL